MGVQLTYDEQRLAGLFCRLHGHGDGYYCTPHDSRGKNDRVCEEMEWMVMKVLAKHAERKKAERGQRHGYPW